MADISTPAQPQNQDTRAPLMGLYLDRPAYDIDPRGFSACNNVRIELNRVRTDRMGWVSFGSQLNGPIVYVGEYTAPTSGAQVPIVATPTDLYRVDNNTFVTPVYDQGTAAVHNGATSVAGTSTRWNSDIQLGDTLDVSGSAAQGSTTVNVTAFSGQTAGLVVTCTSNPGAIQAGTYLVSITGSTLTLSNPLLLGLTSSDTLFVGSGVTLRKNVKVGDQIYFGSASEVSPSATWYTVSAVGSDTSLTITPAYAGTNFSGAYTVRQLLTNETTTGLGSYTLLDNAILPVCVSANFPNAEGISSFAGDQWLFTNGIDPVISISFTSPGRTTFAPSVPFICAAMTRYQNMMIYGGLTLPGEGYSGMSIANSDNSLPYNMAGGVSGQFIVGDGPFSIVRLTRLGSTLMIYCAGVYAGGVDNQDEIGGDVITASFVGFPTLWVFSTVIANRGPLNGRVVAEFPDRHQFVSFDGQYRYNGLFIQVMNDHIWRELAGHQLDASRPGAFNTLVVTNFGDVIWQVPLVTDPAGQIFASTAFVEHYMEQAQQYTFKPYTQRELAFTSLGIQINGSATLYIAGDINGNLWQLYTSDTGNGVPLNSTLTWATKVVGNERSRALVTRVYPSIEYNASPTSPIQVSIALTNSLSGPTTITDTQNFDISYGGEPYTVHYRRGMTVAVTFSNDAGQSFICDGYDLDWQPGGLRLR